MSDYFGAMGSALFSRLAGGTALVTALGGTAIYVNQAPDGADAPFVVFSSAGGGPDNDTPRQSRDNLWYVRAYAGSQAAANLIDGLVDDLLHRGSLVVTGWSVYWLVREMDVALVESPPGGGRMFMAGGYYRVRISE